jgi:hypothetical protein
MDEMELQKTEKPEIVEQPIVVVKQKTKKTECKVILVKSDMIGLSFEGYGISFPQTQKTIGVKIGDMVKVQYHSEIGKADFEINIL